VDVSTGVLHVRDFQSLHQQQVLIHAVRELCVNQPNKFKFHLITDNDQFPAYDGVLSASEESKRPYTPKQNCYTLDISAKDAPEDLKYMPLTLEAVMQGH
jgi:hypothetical protein